MCHAENGVNFIKMAEFAFGKKYPVLNVQLTLSEEEVCRRLFSKNSRKSRKRRRWDIRSPDNSRDKRKFWKSSPAFPIGTAVLYKNLCSINTFRTRLRPFGSTAAPQWKWRDSSPWPKESLYQSSCVSQFTRRQPNLMQYLNHSCFIYLNSKQTSNRQFREKIEIWSDFSLTSFRANALMLVSSQRPRDDPPSKFWVTVIFFRNGKFPEIIGKQP